MTTHVRDHAHPSPTTDSPSRDVDVLATRLADDVLPEATAEPAEELSPRLRESFEARFDLDLSDVRIHGGPASRAVTDLTGARAIATGSDIVLAPDESAHQEDLLGHEVAHVAQARRATGTPGGWSTPGDASEQAADAASHGDAEAATAASGTGAAASRQPKQMSERELQQQRNLIIQQLGILRHRDERAFVEFVGQNEAGIYAVLSKYGFHGCWDSDAKYLADFDQAQMKWLKAEGQSIVGPLPLTPSAEEMEEWERRQNELIWAALPDGTGYMGTRRGFEANARYQRGQRAIRTLDNIRGGIFGALGYFAGGDRGSDLGANVDGVAAGAAGIAAGRQQIRDVGQSLQGPRRDYGAEVRPLLPKAKAPTPSPPSSPAGPPPPRLENAPLPVMPSVPQTTPAAPRVAPSSPEPAAPQAAPPSAKPSTAPAAPQAVPTQAAPAPATTTPRAKPATEAELKRVVNAEYDAVRKEMRKTAGQDTDDVTNEAFAQATKEWRTSGIPQKPREWLVRRATKALERKQASEGPGPGRAPKPAAPAKPGAPGLGPHPEWKREWSDLSEKAQAPTKKANDNGFRMSSATSKDGATTVTVVEGPIGKQIKEGVERGPALPGEQSAHPLGLLLGEDVGPSGQGSAPLAANLSQDKAAANLLRRAADEAASRGATIEARGTVVTQMRTVNGEQVPVQIAKKVEAWARMPGSNTLTQIFSYETAMNPVTRQVSEKAPPQRAGRQAPQEWLIQSAGQGSP